MNPDDGDRPPHRKKLDALPTHKQDKVVSSDPGRKSKSGKNSRSAPKKEHKTTDSIDKRRKNPRSPRPEDDFPKPVRPEPALANTHFPQHPTHYIEPEEITLTKVLGSGTFGQVWLGECRGNIVAIKKLLQQELSEAVLDAFKKEVATMLVLHHPAIVLLMGVCLAPGHLSIVTEYLPRGDLQQLIKEQTLTFIQQCQIAIDVSRGVQWLHSLPRPIIHRDLKPCNILITDALRAKIADFGLSITQETLNGAIPRGTPLWMAPEALLPSVTGETSFLSEKIDVYAYGLVLWQLFTGAEPYESHKNPMAFIEAVCLYHERPQLPHKKIKTTRLSSLIEKCWDPDPKVRPSMAEAEKELKHVVIDGIILDPQAADMWKSHWLDRDEKTVPFPQFAEILFGALGEERTLVSTEYRCIHRLLAEKQESSTTEVVSLQRFGLVVSWIGPFSPLGQSPWLKRVFDVMGMPWFHGDIDRVAAEKLLKTSGQKNCWLIRFSLTEPVWSSPFTISKLVKKNVILHQRVFRAENGYYFYLGTDSSQEKIFREGDFSKLRPELFKHGLKPKKGLQNGKYQDLFSDMGPNFVCMYQAMPDNYSDSETSSY